MIKAYPQISQFSLQAKVKYAVQNVRDSNYVNYIP